jgi:hypothetical protein
MNNKPVTLSPFPALDMAAAEAANDLSISTGRNAKLRVVSANSKPWYFSKLLVPIA